jgi:hypothetical protein
VAAAQVNDKELAALRNLALSSVEDNLKDIILEWQHYTSS